MDWLSEFEEKQLITGMDDMPWDISQSGRRKQVQRSANKVLQTPSAKYVIPFYSILSVFAEFWS